MLTARFETLKKVVQRSVFRSKAQADTQVGFAGKEIKIDSPLHYSLCYTEIESKSHQVEQLSPNSHLNSSQCYQHSAEDIPVYFLFIGQWFAINYSATLHLIPRFHYCPLPCLSVHYSGIDCASPRLHLWLGSFGSKAEFKTDIKAGKGQHQSGNQTLKSILKRGDEELRW